MKWHWALPALVVLGLLVAACNSDSDGDSAGNGGDGEEALVAQEGNTVALHYRGTLDDGSEFDSSAGRDPLTFTVGSGGVIEGFDAAVRGMAVGEKKTFRLDPEQAYGERRDDLVLTVPSENAPEGLEAGQQVMLGNTPATIVSVAENGDVTVDANHRLAGQALTFDIEIVSIE